MTKLKKNPVRKKTKTAKKKTKTDLITPSALVESMDKVIIGQDSAKKALALALFRHQLHIKCGSGKVSILIMGPTGTGKTEMVNTIAKEFDAPFVKVDATSITPSGYKGPGLMSVTQRLLSAAGGDIDKAERGIVMFDEVDKLSSKGKELNIILQNELLKFIEGGEYSLDDEESNGETINTENIMFILVGAFSGIDKIVGKKNSRTKNTEVDYRNVKQHHIVEYGLVPELVGRISSITATGNLSAKMFKEILLKSDKSPLKGLQKIAELFNKEVEISDGFLNSICKSAVEKNLGVRMLKNEIDEKIGRFLYKIDTSVDSIIHLTNEAREEEEESMAS
jgi:ATP-dependent Clp protease ATP-binding subunit ClpX